MQLLASNPAMLTPNSSPLRLLSSGGNSAQSSPVVTPSKPAVPAVPAAPTAPAAPQQPKNPVTPKSNPNLSAAAIETYLNREKAFDTGYKHQQRVQTLLFQEKKREMEWMAQAIKAEQRMAEVEPFEIVYPKKQKRATREISFSEQELEKVAEQKEMLVPIRLDLDVEGVKLRDTFTWNMNDDLLQPEQFAEILCEDLQLPVASFLTPIAKAIREQIDDYFQHAPKALEPPDDEVKGREGEEDDFRDAPELRILIKLDITIGNSCLTDQFEWDLNCKRNSPEMFADHLCKELNLCWEFRTAIAHSIREQLQTYAKSLLLVDHHFDGSPVDDDELVQCFLPPLDEKAIFRAPKQKALFQPMYIGVTDLEIERMEKDMERDTRRKRRQTQ
ncbi:SWI/SNF chromatin-remodeling complex subunit, partial [Rhizophlyctis rosea]